MSDLDAVKQRLIDAMALPPEEHHDWLRHAEHRLYAHRAIEQPWTKQHDVSTVGGRIRTARTALGLSQEQLAIRMRIYQGEVSGWERGARGLPVDKLRTLCAVLAVKKEWILGLSDEGGPPIPHAQLRKKITRNWKEKRDYLDAKMRAKREAEKLNAAYQRRKAE